MLGQNNDLKLTNKFAVFEDDSETLNQEESSDDLAQQSRRKRSISSIESPPQRKKNPGQNPLQKSVQLSQLKTDDSGFKAIERSVRPKETKNIEKPERVQSNAKPQDVPNKLQRNNSKQHYENRKVNQNRPIELKRGVSLEQFEKIILKEEKVKNDKASTTLEMKTIQSSPVARITGGQDSNKANSNVNFKNDKTTTYYGSNKNK